MNTKKTLIGNHSKSALREARAKRLENALRANLKRRKTAASTIKKPSG